MRLPGCPNQKCPNFSRPKKELLVKNGTYFCLRISQKVQRYLCMLCRRTTSHQREKLSFRDKYKGINQRIFEGKINGTSNRASGRLLNINEKTVRRRLKKMHLWALRWASYQQRHLKIKESIVYDGFETFAKSQFHPCHINTAVGSGSHFIYDFNLTRLNRKGRMTEKQKEKRQEIYDKGGKQNPKLLELMTKNLFERLSSRVEGRANLCTDEHPAYQRALRKTKGREKFIHRRVHSKEKRDIHNILFPVNCLDMQLRHFLASVKRETIAFMKTHRCTLQDAGLFYLHKNYMRPIFIKKKDRVESRISPAMWLNVKKKIMQFRDIFHRPLPIGAHLLERDWLFESRA